MPAIEVSCPACGKVNTVEMNLRKPRQGSFVDMFEEVFGEAGGKHYAFEGGGRCSCGEGFDVALNVANRARDKNDPRKLREVFNG